MQTLSGAPLLLASCSALWVVALVSACAREEARAHAAQSVELDGSGKVVVRFGSTVLVDDSLSYSRRTTAGTNQPTVTETRVNGMLMEIHDDAIVLAGQRFEGLVPGDRVRLSRDGNRVNGERRWDLPEE